MNFKWLKINCSLNRTKGIFHAKIDIIFSSTYKHKKKKHSMKTGYISLIFQNKYLVRHIYKIK